MRPGDDQSKPGRSTRRLLTVPEAAEALGLTVDAVRSRIKRGTLPKEKTPDGNVFVVVEDGQDAQAEPTNDRGDDPGGDWARAQARIIERLEDEVTFLRRQLEHRDHLLAAALERIPALEEASPEPRESPQKPSDNGDGTQPPPEPEKRSWWHWFFGFK